MTTKPPADGSPVDDAIPDETVHFDISLARLGQPVNDAIADETVPFDIRLARLEGAANVEIAEADAQEDLERTTVSTRRRHGPEPVPVPAAPIADEDDLDRTQLVERAAPTAAATAAAAPVAEDDDDPERTTVVATRRRRKAAEPAAEPAAAAPAPDDDDPERTTLVERRRPAASETADAPDDDLDRTEIVDRDSDSADTIIVERAAPATSDGDDTVITRPGGATAPKAKPLTAPVLRTRGDRRRGIAPPPVPAGFAPAPKIAVGPGAVESYPTRELDEAREITAPPLGGIAPTRDLSRPLPSAERRARRFGRASIAVFAASCLVSVVGLVAIAIWAL